MRRSRLDFEARCCDGMSYNSGSRDGTATEYDGSVSNRQDRNCKLICAIVQCGWVQVVSAPPELYVARHARQIWIAIKRQEPICRDCEQMHSPLAGRRCGSAATSAPLSRHHPQQDRPRLAHHRRSGARCMAAAGEAQAMQLQNTYWCVLVNIAVGNHSSAAWRRTVPPPPPLPNALPDGAFALRRLMRHGRSKANEAKLIVSRLENGVKPEYGLSPTGVEQATAAG